jgi:hypothetical protein
MSGSGRGAARKGRPYRDFKRKYLLTMDLERYSFGSWQDSRAWMRLGHCIM